MSDIIYAAAEDSHQIAKIIGWEGVSRIIGDGVGKDGMRGVAHAVSDLVDDTYHSQIKQ